MTMEHFYLSIKNTQRKIEDVRNLFKNLSTREKEILECEKLRAERLKLERDHILSTVTATATTNLLPNPSSMNTTTNTLTLNNNNQIDSISPPQSHNTSLSSTSASASPSPPDTLGSGDKTRYVTTASPQSPPNDLKKLHHSDHRLKSHEIIIVENIKSNRRVVTGSKRVVGSTDDEIEAHRISSDDGLGGYREYTTSGKTSSSNDNFQMIQKSDIINFNKLNQMNNEINPADLQKHVNFLLSTKRRSERERDEELMSAPDAVKMHRRG